MDGDTRRTYGSGMRAAADDGTRRTGASFRIVVVAIALFDLALRAEGIVTRQRALSTARFDEGIYSAAAGGLASGALPYRDFVFLHPPGLVLLLAPLAGLAHAVGSWSDFLVAARWFVVLVALANVVLVTRIAWRWSGWLAGVVSGVLYASYLPAVHTEGHVMLEPLVTFSVLVCALLWVESPLRARTNRRAALAGGMAAFAILIKLTGVVALVALLLVEGVRAPWRQRFLAAGAAAAVAGVVLLPVLVLAGPSTVFDQVVVTQFRRPGKDVGGGSLPRIVDRIDHLGSYGPFELGRLGRYGGLMGAALAALLVVWAWRSNHGMGRFLAIAVATGAVAILTSPDYYDQYPVPVFAGIAVLVGIAAAGVVNAIRIRSRPVYPIAMASLALCLIAGVGHTVVSVTEDARRDITNPTALIADAARGKCISADLPQVLLALDRLPPRDRTGDRLVDPFGALVYAALRHHDYATTANALHSAPAQLRLRESLIACPYAVTGGSLKAGPPLLWSESTRTWFLERFEAVIDNRAGLTLWRRKSGAPFPLAVSSEK
jgi:hypothetical protein